MIASFSVPARWLMPTVLRTGAFRFFFYSSDTVEAPHVHVEKGDATAKSWLDPVRLQSSFGFARHEVSSLQATVEAQREHLMRSWHEHFGIQER